jgi:hypothetical protein
MMNQTTTESSAVVDEGWWSEKMDEDGLCGFYLAGLEQAASFNPAS